LNADNSSGLAGGVTDARRGFRLMRERSWVLTSLRGALIGARTAAECGAERSIEIRNVAKPAIEGDVENPAPLRGEPTRGFTQTSV
jgi:hypothetical protein